MIASNRPHHSFPVCKKCQRPVRGHVGPTGSSCSQPSPQFLTDMSPSSSLLPADLATSRFSPQIVSTESGPVINEVQTMHNMATKDAATSLPHRPIAPSHLASLLVPQPQPSTFSAASTAYDSPQVIDHLQQLLHYLQAPAVPAL